MNPGAIEERGLRDVERRALAGLETGVIGGISMLVFMAIHGVLRGQSWWSYGNLLGSVVYGNSALWRGFGRATLAGAAFELVSSGVAGVLFGLCFARTRGRLVSLLTGLSCGLIWFFILHWFVFKLIAPLIPIYATQPATLLGHVILGVVLSRTSTLYAMWQPDPLLSGISGASRIGGMAEIVPQHRLE